MSDTTARLAMPMIVPGQAQKEMSHNEALTTLDSVVQPSVASVGTTAPPPDPAPGSAWIVGAAATGPWTGHAGKLATWTDGGWRFVAPTPGFRVWVADAGVDARFVDGTWRVGTIVGTRLEIDGHALLSVPAEPVSDPVGGGVVDAQARTAIAAILTAMRHHKLLITT